MTHKMHNADAGNIGTAAKRRQIVIDNDNIVTDSYPICKHNPASAVDFALAIAAPSDNELSTPKPSNLATAKQQAYLASLRRAIGLARWNAAKCLLSIETPGTMELTKKEASNLISLINLVCTGRELEK